jgi:hypothetical protein
MSAGLRLQIECAMKRADLADAIAESGRLIEHSSRLVNAGRLIEQSDS